MKKIYGLITLDILLILIPVLIYPVDPDLVEWVGIVFAILTGLTIVTVMGADKNSKHITETVAEHATRPKWWNAYDVITDIAMIASWASIGNYLIGILLILMKAMMITKIPEYYSGAKNEISED